MTYWFHLLIIKAGVGFKKKLIYIFYNIKKTIKLMPRQKVLEKQEDQKETQKEKMFNHGETQTTEENKQLSNGMLQTVYEYVKSATNTTIPVLKWLYFISKLYIIWITIHYISCQLYVHYCVPSGIMGYLISPLLVSSPHCKALRWAFYNGGNIIDNMWNYLGIWCSTQLLKIE